MPAAVLAALYNASRPQGMGFLHYDSTPMTTEQAQSILDKSGGYFDYLQGRVMKINLEGDFVNPTLYDRDNGQGAALAAIETLRETGNEADVSLLAASALGTQEAAQIVRDNLHVPHSMDTSDPKVINFELGLVDVADILGPAVDKALDE